MKGSADCGLVAKFGPQSQNLQPASYYLGKSVLLNDIKLKDFAIKIYRLVFSLLKNFQGAILLLTLLYYWFKFVFF